jgi:hypothetical protein
MIYVVNIGLIDANPESVVGMIFENPKRQIMLSQRPEEWSKLMQSMAVPDSLFSLRTLLEE